jgi:hypothetical protein
MRSLYLFLIVLAGCTSPNKYSYYDDQWMYEKSYSQQIIDANKIANKNRQNNKNKFLNQIPPGDPDEVISVVYQFENYSGLTQADQDRVAASDAYCSTNGIGIKVGQIYNGIPGL